MQQTKMLLNFLTKLTAPIGHKEQPFKSSNLRFLPVVNRLQVSSLSFVIYLLTMEIRKM